MHQSGSPLVHVIPHQQQQEIQQQQYVPSPPPSPMTVDEYSEWYVEVQTKIEVEEVEDEEAKNELGNLIFSAVVKIPGTTLSHSFLPTCADLESCRLPS